MNQPSKLESQTPTPLGRIGQPQDIAGAASSDSAWITGETLLISVGLG
jgi:NAD(P)-dependent dehydrogenase (short-subunit alcohol dehydrogenase family)